MPVVWGGRARQVLRTLPRGGANSQIFYWIKCLFLLLLDEWREGRGISFLPRAPHFLATAHSEYFSLFHRTSERRLLDQDNQFNFPPYETTPLAKLIPLARRHPQLLHCMRSFPEPSTIVLLRASRNQNFQNGQEADEVRTLFTFTQNVVKEVGLMHLFSRSWKSYKCLHLDHFNVLFFTSCGNSTSGKEWIELVTIRIKMSDKWLFWLVVFVSSWKLQKNPNVLLDLEQISFSALFYDCAFSPFSEITAFSLIPSNF